MVTNSLWEQKPVGAAAAAQMQPADEGKGAIRFQTKDHSYTLVYHDKGMEYEFKIPDTTAKPPVYQIYEHKPDGTKSADFIDAAETAKEALLAAGSTADEATEAAFKIIGIAKQHE